MNDSRTAVAQPIVPSFIFITQEQQEEQRQALDNIRQEYEFACLQSASDEQLDDIDEQPPPYSKR